MSSVSAARRCRWHRSSTSAGAHRPSSSTTAPPVGAQSGRGCRRSGRGLRRRSQAAALPAPSAGRAAAVPRCRLPAARPPSPFWPGGSGASSPASFPARLHSEPSAPLRPPEGPLPAPARPGSPRTARTGAPAYPGRARSCRSPTWRPTGAKRPAHPPDPPATSAGRHAAG